MKYFEANSIHIPEGNVKEIRSSGITLWRGFDCRYVSLGDSIAAGHSINADWENDYGTRSQYGEAGGNPSTVIVEDCYTDLIRRELEATYGSKRITAVSFAHSGDTVEDLMKKLDHSEVADAIRKATLVTVCIGANDVLGHISPDRISDYLMNGTLSPIESGVNNSLAILNTDGHEYSYKSLLQKLTNLNSRATFVFTTVYNPYKYAYLEESTEAENYKDGFFGPLMWAIPGSDGNIISNATRGLIYDQAKDVVKNANKMASIAEGYITRLNNIIRNKISTCGNSNIILADTKAVFDPVPDRPVSSPKHYNDLVNVELTRGFNVEELDWGQFWGNLTLSDITNNLNNIVGEVIDEVIENVIVPDMDPHPEEYGQYALKCSFADALGWSALPRRTITYLANGGTGSMASQTVVALDNMIAITNIAPLSFGIPAEGYYWTGWAGNDGKSYTDRQSIGLTGDLILTAMWSNMYTVTYRHSYDTGLATSSDTGPMECYALWIDGVEQSDLGAFSNSARTYRLPYGTSIGVIAQTKKGDARSYITVNGTTVAGTSTDARWGFTLTGDTDIHFEWNYWIEGLFSQQSYWNCYITTK